MLQPECTIQIIPLEFNSNAFKRDVDIGVDNGVNEKMSGCDVLSSTLR